MNVEVEWAHSWNALCLCEHAGIEIRPYVREIFTVQSQTQVLKYLLDTGFEIGHISFTNRVDGCDLRKGSQINASCSGFGEGLKGLRHSSQIFAILLVLKFLGIKIHKLVYIK